MTPHAISTLHALGILALIALTAVTFYLLGWKDAKLDDAIQAKAQRLLHLDELREIRTEAFWDGVCAANKLERQRIASRAKWAAEKAADALELAAGVSAGASRGTGQ